jgi:hypothetical protein
VVDVFDAEALATAVLDARPEIVIHQLRTWLWFTIRHSDPTP